MKPIFFLMLLASFKTVLTQPCTAELMAARPGSWKAGIQGSINNIAAADLTKERSFLQNLQKRISSVYSPLGLEVNYSTVWSKRDKQEYVADPFCLSMYLLRYLCDDSPKGFYVEYSSATNVMVLANHLYNPEILDAAPQQPDHFRGFVRLFNKPEKKDGAIYMGTHFTNNGRICEENWVITRGDSLPFRVLTRKEYLLRIRPRLEKKLQYDREYMQQFMDNIDKSLREPEPELAKMAVCNSFDEERFTGFLPEGDPYAFYPVVPEMNYYRKGLPKSAVQFISVQFKYSINDPVFDKNIASLRKALDFSYLRSLLVK
ncbi:MAG: hypothetical protein KGP35_07255 [Bacteroidetes bacterium]|nr:hypothetical protein [Bacteroidota bacterium]